MHLWLSDDRGVYFARRNVAKIEIGTASLRQQIAVALMTAGVALLYTLRHMIDDCSMLFSLLPELMFLMFSCTLRKTAAHDTSALGYHHNCKIEHTRVCTYTYCARL